MHIPGFANWKRLNRTMEWNILALHARPTIFVDSSTYTDKDPVYNNYIMEHLGGIDKGFECCMRTPRMLM